MSSADPSHAWRRLRHEVRGAVTESAWSIWLEPLTLAALDGDHVVLEAPGESLDWVTNRFGAVIRACATAVLGPGAQVELVGPDEKRSGGRSGAGDHGARTATGRGTRGAPIAAGSTHRRFAGQARTPSADTPATTDDSAPTPASWAVGADEDRFGAGSGTGVDDTIHPRYTFDQFVIGSANRFAHAAALSVAEMPGLAYNPLFICGSPGLGKTHLLHSIANYVRAHGDGQTVRYTTGEAFTDAFVGAIQGHAMERFRLQFRHVDVLLVDDVQFLQDKAKTEQEFFHTFNALQQSGAQLVLTSDRMPRDMDALEDRLRERFEAGLVVDVRPPDHVTRLTILRKRAAQDGLTAVDDAALDLIAERVESNIRVLEGALIRTVAFGSLTGRPVTREVADEVLSGLYPAAARREHSVREIQERACAVFDVSLDDLLSASRTADVAWARQVAMYLARELTGATLPAIGRAFGNRTHTTVLHACRRTAARMAEDPTLHAAVQRLTDELR